VAFLDALKNGPVLIADGAMGTLLQAAGLPSGILPEEWNLSEPARIAAAHQSYLDAGADIILSNSFGGNRIKLSRAHQEGQAERLNAVAVEIVRRVVGTRAFVAGDMGPTGELLAPLGPLTPEMARQAYAEQARWLAAAGADLLVIETMSDLQEAQAAAEGALQATTLPIVCTMSFDTRQRTMMGVTPEKMVETLWPLGLAAIGANCGKSLEENLQVLTRLRAAGPTATLWIKPNAGLPRLVAGQVVYDVGPADFAEYARKFADLGARVVGGCCGSTPAHIAAVRQALAAR